MIRLKSYSCRRFKKCKTFKGIHRRKCLPSNIRPSVSRDNNHRYLPDSCYTFLFLSHLWQQAHGPSSNSLSPITSSLLAPYGPCWPPYSPLNKLGTSSTRALVPAISSQRPLPPDTCTTCSLASSLSVQASLTGDL